MINGGRHHSECVDAWLEQSAHDLPPGSLLQLFEAALGALWVSTSATLGEITITAIVDRALHNATQNFPFFSSLTVEPDRGIHYLELRKQIDSVPAPELREGIRFVLVEFLTVLGNLTAEILTPELHSELSKITVAGAGPPGNEAPGERDFRQIRGRGRKL